MSPSNELENKIDSYTFNHDYMIKRKMYGGISYLLSGNMCFGIYKNQLVLRISPEEAEELLKLNHISTFDVSEPPMEGCLLIGMDFFTSDDMLTEILDIGIKYAAGLPAKTT